MRILHILSQKPSLTGSGTYYDALLRECQRKGVESYLIFALSLDEPDRCYEEVSMDHKSIIRFDCSPLNFPVPGMSDIMPYDSTKFSEMNDSQLKAYFEEFDTTIAMAIERFKPDVIWSHHLWVITAIALQQSRGIPVIAFCHGSDLLQHKKAAWIFEMIRDSLEKCNLIVLTSPDQLQEVECSLKNTQCRYLGNAVRGDIFKLLVPDSLPTPADGTSILCYAGKISKEKGLHILILAVRQLISAGCAIVLEIYGDGKSQESEEIRQMAAGFETKILFKGIVDQNQLSLAFNRANVFILPSFYEGLGLVVIEALACGCSIIMTEIANLIRILPRELFLKETISILHFPDGFQNLQINDCTPLVSDLCQKIERQIQKKNRSREDTASQVSHLIAETLFENLVNCSNSIINDHLSTPNY